MALVRYGWADTPRQQLNHSEMVFIPAGNFIMGVDKEDGKIGLEIGVDSLPSHKVYVDGFYMDKYEVTNKQYRVFVLDTGHRIPSMWVTPFYFVGGDDYPVIDISWDDADAFCRWAGKRLPTEAEWEKAARGTDGRHYPWGNEFDNKKCNILKGEEGSIMPVGSFPLGVSPYGLHDMCGNVMEWTSSWYKPYPGSKLKREAFGERYKVLRGGAWSSPHPMERVTDRHSVDPKWDHPPHGVRCAKSK